MAGAFARNYATITGYLEAVAFVRTSIAVINAEDGMTGALTEIAHGSDATWAYTVIRLQGTLAAGPHAEKPLCVFIGTAASGTALAGYTVESAGLYVAVAPEEDWDAVNERFDLLGIGGAPQLATGFTSVLTRSLSVVAFSGDAADDLPGWIAVLQNGSYGGLGGGAWRTMSPACSSPIWMAHGMWIQGDSGIGRINGGYAKYLSTDGLSWEEACIRPFGMAFTGASNGAKDVHSGRWARAHVAVQAAGTAGICTGWIPGMFQCWDAEGAPDGWPPYYWATGGGFAFQVANVEEIE